LAEHLAAFYWRGEEALEAPDSLVTLFYSIAPPWTRANLAEFIGRSLRNTAEPVPEAIQGRLMRLWDWRLEVLSREPLDDLSEEELQAFAWWVSSGKLPSAWTARSLATVSQLISSTGHDLMFALDQMIELASIHPKDIAAALENFVQKDKSLWHTSAWADKIAETMRRLILTQEKDADRSVRRTADALGRRGFLQFREFALA
jgi:hypothetical protein